MFNNLKRSYNKNTDLLSRDNITSYFWYLFSIEFQYLKIMIISKELILQEDEY